MPSSKKMAVLLNLLSFYVLVQAAKDHGDQYQEIIPGTVEADNSSMCGSPSSLNLTPDYDPKIWAYPPRCEHGDGGNACLYTSNSFAGGRGISMIMPPELAGNVSKLPAFTEEGLLDAANRESDLPYDSKIIPGRGMGAVANRAIKKGERVTLFNPLVMIHVGSRGAAPADKMRSMQHQAIRQLGSEQQGLFLRQHGEFGGDEVEDIINTNSFAMGGVAGEDNTFVAIFPEVSRFNHDCRPNLEYTFDPSSLTQATYAARTIVPGTELTVSYINLISLRSERLYVLQGGWGFKCNCPHCSRSLEELDISDNNIQKFRSIWPNCGEIWNTESSCPLDDAMELTWLAKQERLDGQWKAMCYFQAAKAFKRAGLDSMASKYHQLAYDNTRILTFEL
ncbi:hypothetical protein IWX90DRAFT_256022 [Phyllosticta citrichinensis]|uniref:SET domain-containing protein n=1 Tax=Phyllosticta citrichinensis TaxID=1130410 RepID=A0ABR1XRU0_9PEZI